MLLYELAIILDERSPDVIDAAAQLGLGDLMTASDLDANQVAALRAHFGFAAPPPLAPLGSASSTAAAPPPPVAAPAAYPPAPAPPTGPMVAPPPSYGGPPPSAPPPAPAPAAPASWGPPAPPSSWGPPPGSGAPAPGAPSAAAPPSAAAMPPPAPFAPPVAPPPSFGPSFSYPEAASVPPAGSPFGGSPLAGPGGAVPPYQPPFGPPPGSGPAAPPSGGMSTGQKVLIGGVIAAVIALFAFMAMNTGPDKEREEALAEQNADLVEDLESTTTAPAEQETVPTTTAAPTPAPTQPAIDPDEPVDTDRFCDGGLAITTFELRLTAAISDTDYGELKGLVLERRAAWSDDVGTLAAGAPPALVNDIEEYRGGYNVFFDAIESSSAMGEAYDKIDPDVLTDAATAGQAINEYINSECR